MTKTILVTGASKGIGAATARRLAKDGFDIVLHYNSDREGAAAVAQDVVASGVEARLLQFDISKRDATREVLENDIAENGAPYGIVLNAGVTRDAPFPALEDDDWDSVLHTNLDGFYNVIKPLLMPIIQRRQGGRIVALTSIAGIAGNRGQVNYAASKAGIIGAVKSLALELAKRKITVNAVAPGVIETQMTGDLPEDEVKAMIPMRRYGTTDEIAGTIAFLCSEDASYITRQVISVNGGML
ncbi:MULTISPECIES: 3-oxoacyl-ACP reductase FabG [unclassified Thalassospira]|uniref:3-oxoacyl-ACP reductase FabG n=1 Tax=unclassified Thalassospira TaxID=2648997 RepID=UPI000EDA0C19|nr:MULTISPECIES: 3-oxoacyl-ACP reductase FabG [unclassified Thalassospira]HAI30420.1 3-oxoacyl-ACP reductase FabG [Thalassospira sp.]|tara:strand:+ start:16964 stop:17689 length:726 start_codon:yes stop_codon:yes gene_type:complete